MQKIALIAVLVTFMGGCGRLTSMLDEVVPDRRKDYTRAKTLPDLSVPPGLSSEAIRDQMAIPEKGDRGNYSNYNDRVSEDAEKVAQVTKLRVEEITEMNDQTILVINDSKEMIWNDLRMFWAEQDFGFEKDDREEGILITTWQLTKNALKRDRYKIYAEPGKDSRKTILFLTHQGQELASDDEWEEALNRDVKKEGTFAGLLKEKLHSLSRSDYLASNRAEDIDIDSDNGTLNYGNATSSSQNDVYKRKVETVDSKKSSVTDIQASASEKTVNLEDPAQFPINLISVGRGKYYLTIDAAFSSAWESTVKALELADINIRVADKGRGIFIVELFENSRLLKESRWKLWKLWGARDVFEFQVSVTGIGNKTEIVILDREGRWVTSYEAERLLDRIYNALASN